MTLKDYYKRVSDNGFYTNAQRLQFYLEKQLFPNIDFKDKSLIDIGGGNGLFGFYAALNNASEVVVMEPEFEGSTGGMQNDFYQIKTILGNPSNISLNTDILENYDRSNKYDYILMHNSINHINEEACVILKENNEAQKEYLSFFEKLKEITHSDTVFIACDCARSNFYGDLNLKNPFAPSIEWEKHQNPKFWASLLARAGFKNPKIRWNSPNFMGSGGKFLFSNFPSSYFTTSHFRLEMSL